MLRLNVQKIAIAFSLFFLAPLPLHHIGGAFDPNTVVGWSGIGLILIAFAADKRVPFVMTSEAWLIGISAFGIMSLSLLHDYTGLSALPALLVVAFGLASYSLAGSFRAGRLSVVFVAKSLLFSSVLLCLLTWPSANYFDFLPTLNWSYVYFPIEEGGFRQRNNFATFLVSVIAFSLWSYSLSDDFSAKKERSLVFALLILGVTVFLSGSRIGMLSFVAVSLGLSALFFSDKRSLAIVCFSVLAGSVAIGSLIDFSLVNEGAGGAVLFNRTAETVYIRLGLLYASWLIGLSEPWIGHGWYQFQYLYPELYQNGQLALDYLPYLGSTLHPHNEVMQWWVVGGVLGLVFVVLPIIFFVLRICFLSGKFDIGKATLFVPIGAHSLTGFPLYASGFHWFYLVLVCGLLLSLKDNVPQSSLVIQDRVKKSLVGACGLIVLCVSVELSYTGYKAALLEPLYKQKISSEEYIRYRSHDSILTHWAHAGVQGHEWTRQLFLIALYEQNKELIVELMPRMKEATRFRNDERSWTLLAAAYAGLGKRPELIGFLQYVDNLDPEFADELRGFYGIKN